MSREWKEWEPYASVVFTAVLIQCTFLVVGVSSDNREFAVWALWLTVPLGVVGLAGNSPWRWLRRRHRERWRRINPEVWADIDDGMAGVVQQHPDIAERIAQRYARLWLRTDDALGAKYATRVLERFSHYAEQARRDAFARAQRVAAREERVAREVRVLLVSTAMQARPEALRGRWGQTHLAIASGSPRAVVHVVAWRGDEAVWAGALKDPVSMPELGLARMPSRPTILDPEHAVRLDRATGHSMPLPRSPRVLEGANQ